MIDPEIEWPRLFSSVLREPSDFPVSFTMVVLVQQRKRRKKMDKDERETKWKAGLTARPVQVWHLDDGFPLVCEFHANGERMVSKRHRGNAKAWKNNQDSMYLRDTAYICYKTFAMVLEPIGRFTAPRCTFALCAATLCSRYREID